MQFAGLRGCAASRRQHLASAAPRPYSLNTPSLQLAAPAAAAADAPATSTSAPPKQHQQQKRAAGRNHQQPKQQQQRAPQRRVIPAVLPPPLTDKPFLVRVAGRTSSIQGCAGAIVKRLRTDVSSGRFRLTGSRAANTRGGVGCRSVGGRGGREQQQQQQRGLL